MLIFLHGHSDLVAQMLILINVLLVQAILPIELNGIRTVICTWSLHLDILDKIEWIVFLLNEMCLLAHIHYVI